MGLDAITPLGTQQMISVRYGDMSPNCTWIIVKYANINSSFQLGKWTRREYFDQEHPGFLGPNENVEWHSSNSGRVLQSGCLFWEGFGCQEIPDKPLPMGSQREDIPEFFFK